MAKRYYKSEMYAGYDSSRKQQYADSQMIKYDYSATANLPQGVIMKQYPKTPYYNQPGLDDTLRGIDYQISKDVNGKTIKHGSMPEKY